MAESMKTTSATIQSLRTSPAAHLAEAFTAGSVTGERAVSLRELPFRTMVGVRVDPATEAGRRIADVTGALPASCGDVAAGAGDLQTIWLGPDEFLVTGPDGAHETLAATLLAALGEDPGQVVDLSANRTTLELSGPSAREVLEKSCALDLHPRVFPVGTALATEVGHVPVVLHKTGEESYRILPRASFADYLGRWLLDGMREFASPEAT